MNLDDLLVPKNKNPLVIPQQGIFEFVSLKKTIELYNSYYLQPRMTEHLF